MKIPMGSHSRNDRQTARSTTTHTDRKYIYVLFFNFVWGAEKRAEGRLSKCSNERNAQQRRQNELSLVREREWMLTYTVNWICYIFSSIWCMWWEGFRVRKKVKQIIQIKYCLFTNNNDTNYVALYGISENYISVIYLTTAQTQIWGKLTKQLQTTKHFTEI